MMLVPSNTKLTHKPGLSPKDAFQPLLQVKKNKLLSIWVSPGMKKFNWDSLSIPFLASKRRAFRRGEDFSPQSKKQLYSANPREVIDMAGVCKLSITETTEELKSLLTEQKNGKRLSKNSSTLPVQNLSR
jgi:hypothetical protein